MWGINPLCFWKTLLPLLRLESVRSSAFLQGRGVEPREERICYPEGNPRAGIPTSPHSVFQPGLVAFLPSCRQVVPILGDHQLTFALLPEPQARQMLSRLFLASYHSHDPKFPVALSACGVMGLRGREGARLEQTQGFQEDWDDTELAHAALETQF